MRRYIDLIQLAMDRTMNTDHVTQYFAETAAICKNINKTKINELIEALIQVRIDEGRLFLIGLGGSAANVSHITNDFRKLGNLESYCITDNISELTARANDEGLDTIFSEYLKISKLSPKDALFVCSVGGGAKGVSEGIIKAIDYSKEIGAKIIGITGRNNGYLAKKGDIVVLIPNINSSHVTPHTEAITMVVSHCIVSHPHFQFNSTKW